MRLPSFCAATGPRSNPEAGEAGPVAGTEAGPNAIRFQRDGVSGHKGGRCVVVVVVLVVVVLVGF